MDLRIDNADTKVVATFRPRQYVLIYRNAWGLYKKEYPVDSELWKPGDLVMFLTEADVEIFKAAGFSYVEESQ